MWYSGRAGSPRNFRVPVKSGPVFRPVVQIEEKQSWRVSLGLFEALIEITHYENLNDPSVPEGTNKPLGVSARKGQTGYNGIPVRRSKCRFFDKFLFWSFNSSNTDSLSD